MGFSRQEYWSRLPSLLQGIFLTQVSCIAGRSSTIWATREVPLRYIKSFILLSSPISWKWFSESFYLLDFWRFSLLEIKARKSYFYSRSTGQLSIPLKLIFDIRICLFVLMTQLCPTLCDPHWLWPTRLLCSWDSPGKNNRVDCHALLQEIFLTHRLNPGLLHCRQMLYHLSHKGRPI